MSSLVPEKKSIQEVCTKTYLEGTNWPFQDNILHVSIFIRLSVECRESNRDILMSSQRSLHRKFFRNKHKRFYIAVLSIAQF